MNFDRLHEFLEDFYAKVREDKKLGPVFNQKVSNWDSHLRKIAIFWEHHLLQPGVYKGNPLLIHQKLENGINEENFIRWLTLFEETANDFFEDKELKKICLKARMIGGTLYGRIINNGNLEIPGFPPADMF